MKEFKVTKTTMVARKVSRKAVTYTYKHIHINTHTHTHTHTIATTTLRKAVQKVVGSG